MRVSHVAMSGLLMVTAALRVVGAEPVALSLDSAKVLNRIDEKIYGHFLEHIYHSCNGGLGGELVWNRSFEDVRGGAPHHWTVYGPGKLSVDANQPLNSQACQRIVAESGETGLQQKAFCIRQGETYRGSLWARGTAVGGLAVRLLDGTKVLAEIALPQPSASWQEYPFELRPSLGADNAMLQVGVLGKADACLDQVSMMPESWAKAGGFRPDLMKAIGDLRPPVIRWPGGCYASRYRWKDGIGPQHNRVKYPVSMWDDVDTNSFGIDEFVALCRRVGAEPLIVVNIGMNDPREKRDQYCQEACDWVEYCNGPTDSRWGKVRAANGHAEPYRVKYWEIDNEVWPLKPEDYVDIVRQFVPALKKVDPSIKTIACGSGQLGGYWPNGDATMIASCADIVDYLSIHHYEDTARFADGPAAAEKFLRSRADMIAKSANPKLKLYMSEWNARSTDWRTGLYAAGALNVFERCGDFLEIAGPALFLRHASANDWDNAFVNFDNRTWFPAPNYVVMKLWRDHYAPQRIEMAGDTGKLNAIATKSSDGTVLYFKAVNPSDQSLAIKLTIKEGFRIGDATMLQVAPGTLESRNTLDKPNAIHPMPAPVDVIGHDIHFSLPRWSAGVVTITQQ